LLLKQRTSQLIFFLSDFYEFLRRNEWVRCSKKAENCRQMDPIRFSRVCLRIMTMTRSLWKKRIVESTGRNTCNARVLSICHFRTVYCNPLVLCSVLYAFCNLFALFVKNLCPSRVFFYSNKLIFAFWNCWTSFFSSTAFDPWSWSAS